MSYRKGISGGIPDKLGNRYEAKWLVRCFMYVIKNEACWLNFESIEPEYQGFEFAIVRGEITEWHQTKNNAPKGNWTLNVLKDAGVLSAFAKRLSSDNKAQCFFVSQDNAKDFRDLSDKARLANSPTQYIENALSEKQQDYFKQLITIWNEPDEIVFDWLQRCNVRNIHEKDIESLIESFGDLYFHQGGMTAFPVLRDILESHFNKKITPEIARQAIKSQGSLKFKEWAFDPTIKEKLVDETDAYLCTYSPFGAGGEEIDRAQTKKLIAKLLAPNGPELILLTGIAGSGKSGVVRAAINDLRERNVPSLAFRVDQYLQSGSREDLGKSLIGREESPVSTLKGSFPGSMSVLFIDQVDAISEVSGRNGQIKEVIFRLISDAHNFGNVKIIVVCRSFDLESDPRLKNLKDKDLTEQIEVPLLEWNSDVEPLLKKKNIDVSLFSIPQRQLLCLPVNLAVFLEINDPDLPFVSRSGLHEALIQKKQRLIAQERDVNWSLIKALSAICDWMTERQTLTAPVSVLDDYANAVDVLASEGLIVISRGKLNFFHESFFDHVYARAFINRSHSLVDMLTATEQHLFRRTQVRQILESLRQNDTERYLDELSTVLLSQNIRFHIKTAVCQWLNSIEEPTETEFKIVSEFDQPVGNFQPLFRYAVLSPNWFHFLDSKNWIGKILEGDNLQKKESILWWLSNIAGEFPQEIAGLLGSWWSGNPERANHLLNWFGYIRRNQPDDDLLVLCEEVIYSRPDALFAYHNDDRISMLLHTWCEKSPERCGRVLHALFDCWFELNTDGNPFSNNNNEKLFDHSLTEIADKSPMAFLHGTTDALLRVIQNESKNKKGCDDYDLKNRTYSGHKFGFDAFLAAFRSALNHLSQNSPEQAISYLNKLDPFSHECLMHLHLEAIQSNPEILATRLLKLITDQTVFDAGYNGADWWSFSYACKEAFPFLSPEEKNIVEQMILNHYPEIKRASEDLSYVKYHGENEPFWTKRRIIHLLNISGYEQWCILEIIGPDRLCSEAIMKLNQLRRKFPKKAIPQPRQYGGIAQIVGSPIKQFQCEKMSDKNWLAAIERYDDVEERRRGHDYVDGGANELARQLEELTKQQPARFAELSLKIPNSANICYVERILWGLAETENVCDETLKKAVKHAGKQPDKPFGLAIARLIQKHPQITTDIEILEFSIWYALYGDASEDEISDQENTKLEIITIDKLVQRGGGMRIRGINGVRGWMWEALASVLWNVPETTTRIWEALDLALDHESLVSVRCCMIRALTSLFNNDKIRFTQSMRKLIKLPDTSEQPDISLSPLITPEGIHLFPYLFHWLPALADELVNKLLESNDETKRLIGAWLIFCESFRNDVYISKADQLASISVEHRRLLADVTADSFKWTGNRNRAESLLRDYFYDEDEKIRNHAADVFRMTDETDAEIYQGLAKSFIQSPAFTNNAQDILYLLEKSIGDVLELVISFSERLLQETGDNEKRIAGTYYLDDILKREYASSESNRHSRKRILDIIDQMLCKEIYGINDIVSAHDRW